MSIDLDIRLAQLNPIVGDLAYNKDKIFKAWQENDEADLILFPELVICGYPPEDLILKPFFIAETKAAIEDIVTASKDLKAAAVIGCPWEIDGKIYNAAHLIEGGEIKATITKHHLPNYGVFDERRVFTKGSLPEPTEFRGHNLGLMICEDMWFAGVAAHLKTQGAEALLVINASPYDCGKDDIRLDHATTRVMETELPLYYVNQIGGQDELVFDGKSFVLNKEGTVIAEGKFCEEDILSIPPSPPRGEGWGEGDKKQTSKHPHPNPLPQGRGDNNCEEIYSVLVLGLRDYINKNNFPGVLLGLSGGIDSALSAVIAVDALGADKVRAVMMPSQYTSQDSLDDAEALAKNLGIKLDTMPIEDSVQSINALMDSDAPSVTFENIQSRIRGLILMALSNASGHMVLSTGNKSEMAVGYATLYGDMNGGFNALKDVYKTQVYELSRWRNKQGHVIPERIITKAPTAELKDNQTDQDTLPEYEELDDILICLIEHDHGIEEIVKRGHDHETVAKVWKMLDRAEYKRRQAPPGVKITTRAFGRERRYPITNHFLPQSLKSKKRD